MEMKMRGLWAAVAALACLPGAAQAQGALGANFNEHYEDVDYRDLEKAGARWVRLFVPMPQLDRGAAEHGAVRAILEAHDRGDKTILTLKFPYPRGNFTTAGTPAFEREPARVDAALPPGVGKERTLGDGK